MKNANGFNVVVLFEHYLYYLGLLRRNHLADKVRLDRKLAMFAASIDQYGELHFPRPAGMLRSGPPAH